MIFRSNKIYNERTKQNHLRDIPQTNLFLHLKNRSRKSIPPKESFYKAYLGNDYNFFINVLKSYLNGQKFDSSRDRGQPFSFLLGAGQVIQGWDRGVQGMKVGGVRKLVIPSNLAYGEAGSPPVIPPNSPLDFDIELLDVQ